MATFTAMFTLGQYLKQMLLQCLNNLMTVLIRILINNPMTIEYEIRYILALTVT